MACSDIEIMRTCFPDGYRGGMTFCFGSRTHAACHKVLTASYHAIKPIRKKGPLSDTAGGDTNLGEKIPA